MEVHFSTNELSPIPENDEDRQRLQKFMEHVDNGMLDADMDGVNLDELVLSQVCDEDGSHCRLCGKRK